MSDGAVSLVHFPGSVVGVVTLIGNLDFLGGGECGASRKVGPGIAHNLYRDVSVSVVHQHPYRTASEKPRFGGFDRYKPPGPNELTANSGVRRSSDWPFTLNHGARLWGGYVFVL